MACKPLCFLMLLMFFATGCKPCERQINGYCYDTPNKANPGLTPRWEMIDLETGKPIPDVWIGLSWSEYKNTRSRGECARMVIGRTDANGRFSDTAKDGSWISGQVTFYKPGYELVRHANYLHQTHITHVHEPYAENRIPYQAWGKRLEKLGYAWDESRNAYRKDFELGKEYQRIYDDIYSPKGLRIYWLKQRSYPSRYEYLGVNYPCSGSAAPGRTIEQVGFDDPKNQTNYIEKWQGLDAYQQFCDDNWNTVPKDLIQRYEAGFAFNALALTGEKDYTKKMAQFESYFGKGALDMPPKSQPSNDQRNRFCMDLKPLTKIGISP